jgi:hypothetical protein
VPLEVELDATWSFQPPGSHVPPSGIPSVSSGDEVGTTTLRFTQRIKPVGEVTIEPPAQELVSDVVTRQRPERQRQMLTGERPISDREERKADRDAEGDSPEAAEDDDEP